MQILNKKQTFFAQNLSVSLTCHTKISKLGWLMPHLCFRAWLSKQDGLKNEDNLTNVFFYVPKYLAVDIQGGHKVLCEQFFRWELFMNRFFFTKTFSPFLVKILFVPRFLLNQLFWIKIFHDQFSRWFLFQQKLQFD